MLKITCQGREVIMFKAISGLKAINERQRVIVVAITIALCLLGDSMLYIALPLFWGEVGLNSLWEVGLLLSVNRVIRLPFHPLVGWLYKRIPLRSGLIAAVVLTTVVTVGYGLWDGFWVWLVLRSAWGIAWSFLILGGLFTVVTYSEEDNRGYLMGTFNGFYRLGSLFGMLLGGILSGIIGIKNVAVLFGAFPVVGIPLLYLYITRHKPSAMFWNETSLKISWFSRQAFNVFVSGLLVAMLIRGLLASTLSLVIDRHFDLDVLLWGLVLGAGALSGIIQAARWTWEPFLATHIGRLSDGPSGRTPLLALSLVIAALGFFLVPLSFPLFPWLLIILLVMVTATSLTTLIDSLAADLAKRSSSLSLMTAYSMAVDLGAALGPLISYLVIMLKHGLFLAYAGGGFVCLCLAFWWYCLWRKSPVWLHKSS